MNLQPLKENTMSAGKSSIDYLRMEPATNGFIISYNEKTKSPGKGTYENCFYRDVKEVFDIDDASETDDIEKAFTRFRELAMRQYTEMKSK